MINKGKTTTKYTHKAYFRWQEGTAPWTNAVKRSLCEDLTYAKEVNVKVSSAIVIVDEIYTSKDLKICGNIDSCRESLPVLIIKMLDGTNRKRSLSSDLLAKQPYPTLYNFKW